MLVIVFTFVLLIFATERPAESSEHSEGTPPQAVGPLSAASSSEEGPSSQVLPPSEGPSRTSYSTKHGQLYTTPQNFYSWTMIVEVFMNDRRCIPHSGESEDVSVVIWSGTNVNDIRACKKLCMEQRTCSHFAYGKTWRCELYDSCYGTTEFDYMSSGKKQEPKRLKDVKIFRRLSECDNEMDHGRGRYPRSIEMAFPDHIVRREPPHQNLHCTCVTGRWAICGIFYVAGSEEEAKIVSIIMPGSPKPPFSLNPLMDGPDASIVFAMSASVGGPINARVFAEMEGLHVDRCLHLSMCTDSCDICPVTGKPFQAGDAVYLLKSDVQWVRRAKAVPCISAGGMMHLSMALNPFTQSVYYTPVQDPHGRYPEQKLNSKLDYELYFLFDDDDFNRGLCAVYAESELEPSDLEQLSLEDEPSSVESSASEFGSPNIRGRKTRRGGKKKKGGAPRSQSVPPRERADSELSTRAEDSVAPAFQRPGGSEPSSLEVPPTKAPTSAADSSSGGGYSSGSPARKVSFSYPDPRSVPERSPTKTRMKQVATNVPFVNHFRIYFIVFFSFSVLGCLFFQKTTSDNVYLSFQDLEH